MIFFYVIGIPLLVVAGTVALSNSRRDSDALLSLMIAAVGCAAIWLCFILPIYYTSRAYDRSACHAWGQRTGRSARFAQYTTFKWECLTQTHDGKWISKDQVGDYNK